MTPEQQRIAIAEWRGWQRNAKGPLQHEWWYAPDGFRRSLPDFCGDLNAIHEAEKALTEDQRHKRAWLLVQIVDGWKVWRPEEYEPIGCWEMSLCDIDDCLLATAAQRAEALCRTLFPDRFNA